MRSNIHIETNRLILRVPRIEDFDRYAELLADATACRYLGGHMPRAAAWRRFLQMPGAWAVRGFAMFSVLEKSSGRWLDAYPAIRDWLARVAATPRFVPLPEPDAAAAALVAGSV